MKSTNSADSPATIEATRPAPSMSATAADSTPIAPLTTHRGQNRGVLRISRNRAAAASRS